MLNYYIIFYKNDKRDERMTKQMVNNKKREESDTNVL